MSLKFRTGSSVREYTAAGQRVEEGSTLPQPALVSISALQLVSFLLLLKC
jgi:hypothetical protein